MKVSTQTEVIGQRFDDFTAVRMICEAGFDAIDFSMFRMKHSDDVLNLPEYMKHIKEVKNIADSYGVCFDQAHAPFPTIKEGDGEYNKAILPRIRRSIEIAGFLGVENIVVHPVAFKEDKMQKNVEMYMSLLDDAKNAGVRIALENMFGHAPDNHDKLVPNICSLGEEFAELYDMLPKEYFSCCVDIGHCYLVGTTAPDVIRALGHDRLACLHVHDNDLVSDWHFPPFMLDIKFDEVAKALADVDYNGYITLESDNVLRDIPYELLPSMLKYMYDSAKLIADKTEEYK